LLHSITRSDLITSENIFLKIAISVSHSISSRIKVNICRCIISEIEKYNFNKDMQVDKKSNQ
jgi:hypothetical protein